MFEVWKSPVERGSEQQFSYKRYLNWFLFRYWNTSQTPIRQVIRLNPTLIK